MYNMIENDVLFEMKDQQYVDVSVLANSLVEEVYTLQDKNKMLDNNLQDEESKLTPEELIKKVHGGKNSHKGALRTWNALNKFFPGHGISYMSCLSEG